MSEVVSSTGQDDEPTLEWQEILVDMKRYFTSDELEMVEAVDIPILSGLTDEELQERFDERFNSDLMDPNVYLWELAIMYESARRDYARHAALEKEGVPH